MDGDAVRELANDLPREPGVYQFLGDRLDDVERTRVGVDGTRGDGDHVRSDGEEARPGADDASDTDGVSDADGASDNDDANDADDAAGSRAGTGDRRVLYVGKAVDLRDRVRSYADPRSERIASMVANAADVDVAVTDTETQALLLEANLIKRHQPRYNVRLTDDKSYPLVQFTAHEAPQIEVTRDPDPGATVYGPFTHRGELEEVVKSIREVYGLRGCSDHKYANRDRPCLDHEIGLCSAPCTGEIDAASYAEDVEAAQRFFEGETGVLADPLGRRMDDAAEDRQFERAAALRDRLETVRSFHGDGSAAVASASAGDGEDGAPASHGKLPADPRQRTHVLGAAVDGRDPTVAVLESEGGKLVDRYRPAIEVPEDAADDPASLLAAFAPQYYADRTLPDRLLLPEEPADADVRAWLEERGVDVEVPGAGREARLVDLALKNARRAGPGEEPTRALADALEVESADRVECFDVSHAGGKATVGSNVVAVDGREHTDGYRRKKLPEGNDDPDRMRRLVAWRARRAVEGRDDRPDPDLLLIDGGAAQLAAACEALEDVGWSVPVAAIAKDPDGDRLLVPTERGDGRVAVGGDGDADDGPPAVDRTRDGDGAVAVDRPDGVTAREVDVPESAQRLCERVRDEAHRFAVQYHQTVRDRVSTVLDDIDGVGPATRQRLLRRFGSVESIREASREELEDVEGVGPETASTLLARL